MARPLSVNSEIHVDRAPSAATGALPSPFLWFTAIQEYKKLSAFSKMKY